MNGSGDKIGSNLGINEFLTGVGGTLVTNWKILGANYGATVLFCFADNRLQSSNSDSKSPFNLSDTFLQPVQLGWHFKRGDVIAGYSLYLPTGRYSYGGDKNSGLGMWTNEFSAGGTFYFDKERKWNVSTVGFYEIHSKKKDSETRAGDILTLEGGAGKTFYCPIRGSKIPMPINFGVVYYGQFKMTDDRIAVGQTGTTIPGVKDHVWAVGLEANAFYPKSRTSVSLRWLAETGARDRFQGNTFMITLSQFLKMYEKK